MRKPNAIDYLAIYAARGCATKFQMELLARTVLDCSRKAALAYVRRGFLRNADVDDVCQETWARIFARLQTFDAQKAAFETWIGVVARSVVGDFRRQYGKDAVLVPLEGDVDGD